VRPWNRPWTSSATLQVLLMPLALRILVNSPIQTLQNPFSASPAYPLIAAMVKARKLLFVALALALIWLHSMDGNYPAGELSVVAVVPVVLLPGTAEPSTFLTLPPKVSVALRCTKLAALQILVAASAALSILKLKNLWIIQGLTAAL